MKLGRMVSGRLVPALLAILCVSGCADRLAIRPDVYQADKVRIQRQNYTLNPVLVKPISPGARPVLIIFASGDSGLKGLSKTIVQHLANGGYYVGAFSSREVLGEIKGSRELVPYAEAIDHVAWITSEVKAKLGLTPDTRMIFTGLSRGANIAVLAATSKALKDRIAGAVTISLTREFDYVSVSSAAFVPPDQLDEKQRPETAAVIDRIGTIPLAIVESTHDRYVPSTEWRKLLGPDTPTRRLYEVNSKSHSFAGGQLEMLRDLDDALNWIVNLK